MEGDVVAMDERRLQQDGQPMIGAASGGETGMGQHAMSTDRDASSESTRSSGVRRGLGAGVQEAKVQDEGDEAWAPTHRADPRSGAGGAPVAPDSRMSGSSDGARQQSMGINGNIAPAAN